MRFTSQPTLRLLSPNCTAFLLTVRASPWALREEEGTWPQAQAALSVETAAYSLSTPPDGGGARLCAADWTELWSRAPVGAGASVCLPVLTVRRPELC